MEASYSAKLTLTRSVVVWEIESIHTIEKNEWLMSDVLRPEIIFTEFQRAQHVSSDPPNTY
jgi:hypothetical protein